MGGNTNPTGGKKPREGLTSQHGIVQPFRTLKNRPVFVCSFVPPLIGGRLKIMSRTHSKTPRQHLATHCAARKCLHASKEQHIVRYTARIPVASSVSTCFSPPFSCSLVQPHHFIVLDARGGGRDGVNPLPLIQDNETGSLWHFLPS